MRILLDTHVFLWWAFDDPRLSSRAHDVLGARTTEPVVSAASAWEITTKHRLGKLPEAGDLPDRLMDYLTEQRFVLLPITAPHAAAAGRLRIAHKDPFDRLLMAQANLEGLTILTADRAFTEAGVKVLW